MNERDREIKKRLMFVKGEDLYFLTYNSLVLLDGLKCIGSAMQFHDARKLPFLIDFVSDSQLSNIVERTTGQRISLGSQDAQALSSAYANGLFRKHFVQRLLYTLEQKGVLHVERENGLVLKLSINADRVRTIFIDSQLFQVEYENVGKLVKLMPRLRQMKFETMLERLFDDRGLKTWRV